ncbi:MAG: hypothetical protein ACRDPW_05250 [Mycobacteriales bacterium]
MFTWAKACAVLAGVLLAVVVVQGVCDPGGELDNVSRAGYAPVDASSIHVDCSGHEHPRDSVFDDATLRATSGPNLPALVALPQAARLSSGAFTQRAPALSDRCGTRERSSLGIWRT